MEEEKEGTCCTKEGAGMRKRYRYRMSKAKPLLLATIASSLFTLLFSVVTHYI